MTESCDDKTFQIPEKDKEIANVIPKLKPTECNEMSSRIEESSAKNNIEQDICNKDNYSILEKIQFDNNTEDNIFQININKKDTDKEDSTEHKEVNVYEN